MAVFVKLPQMGQTMEEGTVVSCKVKVGDKVSRGDIVFDIETDKTTLEMESPAEGYVKALLVKEGDTIPVNTDIMILGEENEVVDISSPEQKTQAAEKNPAEVTPPPSAPAACSPESALPASAIVIPLAQMGQTMEEGTIVSCKVKIDDFVKRGDILFDIETDKTTLEMESPAEGYVKAILVKEGDTVPVNEKLLILAGKDDVVNVSAVAQQETAPAVSAQTEVKPAPAPAVKEQTKPEPKAAAVEQTDRIFASPRARATAKEMGVSLSQISGSGKEGRIIEADVLNAGKSGASAKAAMPAMPAPAHKLGDVVPVSRIMKITGEKMVQSKQTIPCFYLTTTVDMTELVEFRSAFNKKSSVKVAFNDFIIAAIAKGIKQFPIMAGQLDGSNIKIAPNINIGLAVSVGDDLMAPVVKSADTKTAAQIAADTQSLVEKVRSGKISPADLSEGVCTLSNLGAFGVESFIPIAIPGQCSIFGAGKIVDTIVPSQGSFLLKKMMSLTISVDHRVANGAYAAQFLDFVKKLLENPQGLV